MCLWLEHSMPLASYGRFNIVDRDKRLEREKPSLTWGKVTLPGLFTTACKTPPKFSLIKRKSSSPFLDPYLMRFLDAYCVALILKDRVLLSWLNLSSASCESTWEQIYFRGSFIGHLLSCHFWIRLEHSWPFIAAQYDGEDEGEVKMPENSGGWHGWHRERARSRGCCQRNLYSLLGTALGG